jgi:hypothetical protein
MNFGTYPLRRPFSGRITFSESDTPLGPRDNLLMQRCCAALASTKGGEYSNTSDGLRLFDVAAKALEFFCAPHWKGPRPRCDTALCDRDGRAAEISRGGGADRTMGAGTGSKTFIVEYISSRPCDLPRFRISLSLGEQTLRWLQP